MSWWTRGVDLVEHEVVLPERALLHRLGWVGG